MFGFDEKPLLDFPRQKKRMWIAAII